MFRPTASSLPADDKQLVRRQTICSGGNAFRFYRQRSFSRLPGALQQNLGKAVEGVYAERTGISIRRALRGTISRVAIAYAEDADGTADGQRQFVASRGDKEFLLILKFDTEDGHVTVIGLDGRTVGGKGDAGGGTGGCDLLGEQALACLLYTSPSPRDRG